MIIRRRLVVWLIKAYLARWGKTILFFFLLGCIAFFALYTFVSKSLPKSVIRQNETIGLAGGPYELTNLPSNIILDVAHGLTSVSKDGTPKPDIAESWNIKDSGKTYEFNLKHNIRFSDGTPLTSNLVSYDFSDTKIEHPDKYTVVFKLKDIYAPFLLTVSRPIFKDGIVGVGDYKIPADGIKLNGGFVESLTLISTKDSTTKRYQFYPSVSALKTAYALGEVTTAEGLPDIDFENTTFASFPTTTIQKNTDYQKLVTLFYNNVDPVLSDKKIRSALSYAVPDTFNDGQRSYTLYPPTSWAYEDVSVDRKEDLDHAKLLLDGSSIAKTKEKQKFKISTLPKYKDAADEIAKEWKKLGVNASVEEVNNVPSSFQIFLGDFTVIPDPDQYSLWHSNQLNNITRYESPRIDKLLEDGRKTVNQTERKKIYADLQKYLLADSPATFLYFPYEYTITRR